MAGLSQSALQLVKWELRYRSSNFGSAGAEIAMFRRDGRRGGRAGWRPQRAARESAHMYAAS
jgi:hypothetical protein